MVGGFRKRDLLHFLSGLPFFFPLLCILDGVVFPMLNFTVPLWGYIPLLIIAILAYWILRKNEKELYTAGDLPAHTSIFLPSLFMLPFVLLYSPSINAANNFLLLDGAIVVVVSIFTIAVFSLKKKDLPETDSLSGFLLMIVSVIVLTILGVAFFAFDKYLAVGFVLNYMGIYLLLSLSIYLIQIFARKEGLTLMTMMNNR